MTGVIGMIEDSVIGVAEAPKVITTPNTVTSIIETIQGETIVETEMLSMTVGTSRVMVEAVGCVGWIVTIMGVGGTVDEGLTGTEEIGTFIQGLAKEIY